MKLSKIFFLFLVLFLLPYEESIAQVSQSKLDLMLREADDLRTQNPGKMKDILSEINNSHINLLTTEQKNYFSYLNSYKMAYSGDFKNAIAELEHLSESENVTSINLKTRAKLTLINLLALIENWPLAIENLHKILPDINKIEDIELKQIALGSIAIFYNQLNQFNLSLEYSTELNKIANSPRNICFANKFTIESQLNLNQIFEMGPEVEHAINICQEAGELLEVSEIRAEAAKKMLEHQRLSELIKFLNLHLYQAEKTKYNKVISEFYSMLAEAYLASGESDLAKHFALKTLEAGKELGNAISLVRAYKVLYQLAENAGDYKSALEYHIQYALADNKNLDAIKAKQLAFQLGQQNFIEQQNKIERLDHQNKILTVEKQLSQSNANRNQLLMILLVIGLIVAFFWAYRIKRSHEKLRLMAEYDELTGVYSRAHFKLVAQSTLEYCNHTEQEICCIIFDLDQFKNINDSFGHAAGDWVLKTVIDLCLAQAPKQTIFARIGGEEFCVLMPATPLISALNYAQSCRKDIEKIVTADTGHHFNVSASFGVTSSRLSGYSLDKLLDDADTAMYVSKKMGRNRVTQHFRELDEPNDTQNQGDTSLSPAKD